MPFQLYILERAVLRRCPSRIYLLWINLQDLGVIGNGTGGHVGMTRSSPIPSLTGSTTSENRRPGCGTSCCSRGLCGTRSTCGRKPILRRSRQANLPGLRGLRRRIRSAYSDAKPALQKCPRGNLVVARAIRLAFTRARVSEILMYDKSQFAHVAGEDLRRVPW